MPGESVFAQSDPQKVCGRMPAVSVIIPTHNRLPMVLNAVESALAQTFGDREIIVADDGSTDGTAAALRQRFAERVRLISLERNSGLPAAAPFAPPRVAGWPFSIPTISGCPANWKSRSICFAAAGPPWLTPRREWPTRI